MGRSISPMCETTVTGGSPSAAPRLIVPKNLRLAIPRRVALQQSSPPLHQPTVILKQKERLEKENPLNGKCASFRLSQLRGSPQKPVLLTYWVFKRTEKWSSIVTGTTRRSRLHYSN